VKTHRLQVVPTPAQLTASKHERARLQLRTFARFIEKQDPEALAASVEAIDVTLESCAKIDRFFRAYVAALAERRVH
jgi:hypothetical protein